MGCCGRFGVFDDLVHCSACRLYLLVVVGLGFYALVAAPTRERSPTAHGRRMDCFLHSRRGRRNLCQGSPGDTISVPPCTPRRRICSPDAGIWPLGGFFCNAFSVHLWSAWMNPALISFTGGLVTLAAYFILILAVLRIPGRVAPVTRQGLLALVVHVIGTYLTWCLAPQATYWHGTALYMFGVACFVFGFGAVYKSISLQILSRLAAAPNQTLDMGAIVERQVRPCFTQRMALLVGSGLAESREPTFVVAPQGTTLANRITFVQRIFGVGESGLYGVQDRQNANNKR